MRSRLTAPFPAASCRHVQPTLPGSYVHPAGTSPGEQRWGLQPGHVGGEKRVPGGGAQGLDLEGWGAQGALSKG